MQFIVLKYLVTAGIVVLVSEVAKSGCAYCRATYCDLTDIVLAILRGAVSGEDN